MGAPAVSKIVFTAAVISMPIPSPGISTTFFMKRF
jgi:hypothetical protein